MENPGPRVSNTREVSSLWLAIVSSGAALFGALIGGIGGYAVANRQIDAEREDVRRVERRQAYLDVLNVLVDLNETFIKLDDERAAVSSPSLLDEVCAGVDTLRSESSVLFLAGSLAAQETANDALEIADARCKGEEVDPDLPSSFSAAMFLFIHRVRAELEG